MPKRMKTYEMRKLVMMKIVLKLWTTQFRFTSTISLIRIAFGGC